MFEMSSEQIERVKREKRDARSSLPASKASCFRNAHVTLLGTLVFFRKSTLTAHGSAYNCFHLAALLERFITNFCLWLPNFVAKPFNTRNLRQ